MANGRVSRRDFVYLCIGGGLLAAGFPLARVISQSKDGKKYLILNPTPSNTLGPYYKSGAPRREKLTEANEKGTPLLVTGRVFNIEGKPLTNATVEVFHANAMGDYDMEGWRWRGEIPLNAGGEYSYETVVPGQYGGRAQHVHYMINAPGHKRLVTQLYFENDPKFAGNPDKNYTRDGLVWHRELIRPVANINRNGTAYSAVTFDICLEKT